ncbi:hypothetical protein [Prevotella jejuni]|nr:hypothetical protein [Prevotella jejuni]
MSENKSQTMLAVSNEQKEHSKPVLGNKCHTMLAVSSEQKECRKPALR